MKEYQFEEITMALSIIICLLAYKFEINWLFWIFLFKSIFDTICALIQSFISAVKSAKKDKNNNSPSQLDR